MAPSATGNPLSFGHLSLSVVRSLLQPHVPPCLSLYLPTHRRVPDNRVDPKAFEHLVDALEMALSASRPRREFERLLEPFRAIQSDTRFWQHTRDGLAVLASDGHAELFLLQRTVKPLALVSGRFHTMPLLRIAASIERFNVLVLTSRLASVYEATAHEGAIDRLDQVFLSTGTAPAGPGTTGTIAREDVVDDETFQPHRVRRGLGGHGLGEGGVVHGGSGSRRDVTDADTEIFLRAVDDLVWQQVTNHSGLPLVVVAPARLARIFQGLSRNRLLLGEPIATDAHLLPEHELPALVAPVCAAARAARIARDVDAFLEARDHGLGAGDLSDVARAAVAGRVATLLIEKDRFEPGRLDPITGAISGDGPPVADLSRGGGPAATTDDLFNAVAETVLLHGGGIVALDRLAMPTESGVAAIYRY